MIYIGPGNNDPVDQGDLVDDCPVLSLKKYDLDLLNPPEIGVASCRVLVLTQTCDLANGKASTASVAVAFDSQDLVDQGLLKPADIRGPIRSGRVYGWYFLPENLELGISEMLIDLRQLHTVRLDLLADLVSRGRRRARLQSPYREHLSKHFADTYSRIGLPEPYETR
jgi:hypothetical protein